MTRLLWLLLAGCAVLAGCNPTLNWRELTVGDSGLKVLLPCKPDQGRRPVVLAGQALEMTMLGCEAGKALFVVAYVHLDAPEQAGAVQAQWQAAMLANMQAGPAHVTSQAIKGAAAQPAALQLRADGRREDGSAVMAQGVWFARDKQLYHAAVYADRLDAHAVEAFFAGLALQ